MKTIGLIGGMSWESSAEYYRIINETTKKMLGGLHSAKLVMYSVEFDEIVRLQHEGNWDELTAIMVDAAQRLKRAGAELIVIGTNTMHKMAAEVEAATNLPLLHIADATAIRIKEQQLKTVALLGTKFTMEQDFYRERFIAQATNARALQRAQLSLIERGRKGESPVADADQPKQRITLEHPFFWAPFVVTGNLPSTRASR